MSFVLAVDIGSTHLKCALYQPDLKLVASSVEELPLEVSENHVESDPHDWWRALREAVPRLLREAAVDPSAVAALSFCAQMQGVVLVDRELEPLRRCIGYLDTRATEVFADEMQRGLLKVEGVNARKLLESVWRTNIAPGTPKDTLWKVRWLMRHEPEVMARAYKWLDVKDWLVAQCTGRACTTADSAHLSCLFTFAREKSRYSEALCRLYGIAPGLLPEVVQGNQVAGLLTAQAASALGLAAGTPVVAGGGDISCVAFGAGAVDVGDVHVYLGTSGWVAQTTERRMLDTSHFIASLRTCLPSACLYLGELQTAGVCLSWMDKLLGEPDGPPSRAPDYDALGKEAAQSPAGARGLLFAPWLHGSRSPNEDPHARGVLLNLNLEHRRSDVLRAVFEGVALHLAWILEVMEAKAGAGGSLRFVGGGARSPLWAQALADATGKTVNTVADPQTCGARGAALLALSAIQPGTDLKALARQIAPGPSYVPKPEHTAIYRSRRAMLGRAHRANKKLFRELAAA